MKKKIVFVVPPIVDKLWTFSSDLLYLGAAGLAARLLQDGHEVSAIDCAVDCRSVGRLKRRLARLQPDIVAVPALYGTLINAYKIAAAAKEATGALVVFGGLPATFSAEQVLTECPQADVCVVNEGELAMSALAAGRPPAEIPGLVFRRDGAAVATGPGSRVENLDELPFPARGLFPQEKYRVYSLRTFRQVCTTNMESKRGCPFACEFCLQAPKEGRRYRLRSPEKVIEEMRQIKRDFPHIGRIMFVDNDFLAPYEHGLAIVDGIIAAGLNRQFEFMVAARVDNFLRGGDALIAKFAEANIRLVYFGMESVNAKNRERLSKIKAEYAAPELLERMRAKGVHSLCSYIFGFENEDESDMLETVRASMKDAPSMVKYNILTPYPGTKTHADYLAQGRLLPGVRLWQLDNAHQTIKHPVDCARFFRRAYRRYYFSPALLAKIKWLRFFGENKDMKLLAFVQHLGKRELAGFARDVYRFFKFRVFRSEDFVG
ncbi:MAG: hypothetical protein A2049_06940 [Elusimicrobia bacterium GWA2_62_23]|nr:MAG: hypothetical protein A2049_06940 [Elusimicrobia bacterium GWA2_62_23]OGR71083.1 MAG: hypothetical protein A2179_06150 [Elusimicrobia bacterium GWC2_63_65]